MAAVGTAVPVRLGMATLTRLRGLGVLAAMLVTFAAMLVARGATACEAARSAAPVDELPGPWRQALEQLVAATADPTMPWGCPAATIQLVPDAAGACLHVTRPSREIVRRCLSSPAELLPTGKALLARPLPPTPPATLPAVPASANRAEPKDHATAPSPEPRFLVDASGMVRYAGGSDLLAAGPGIRGALSYGPWAAALWFRYAELITELGGPTPDLGFGEYVFGVTGSYALTRSPVKLTVGLSGAAAVVDMGTALPSSVLDEQEEVESGVVDGRIGSELRVLIPLSAHWHVGLSADADVTPASLARPGRRLDSRLPPLPSYSVGLAAGIGVGIP